jgi:ABC-2 type transport system ATP-binding protein
LKESELVAQLDLVGLADRKDSKISTFSQGMKQRLGIAVALVHGPELIILDEPTNGLDPQGIADMRNLIVQLSKERGKTVLVSSHLLSEIEIIANRMLIIHKGEKVVEGDVKRLLDPSKTTVTLDTTDNVMALAILRESAWFPNLTISDELIRLEMSKNDIEQLVKFLVEKGVGVHLVQPRHSLEEYFLNLTNTNAHAAPFAN